MGKHDEKPNASGNGHKNPAQVDPAKLKDPAKEGGRHGEDKK